MATCENCSTSFTPNPNATEVSSTRILCPQCEAARRAEKQRKAAAAAASGAARPAASAAAPAGAPPVPAARRVAPAGPSSASSAAAAPARTARPAAARAPEPAPAPSASRASGAATSRVTARPASKPSASKGKSANVPSDVRREADLIKKEQDKVFVYAWIICGVLLLIAGGVVFSVWSTKQADLERFQAAEREVSDFAKKVKGYNVEVESQAQEVVTLIENNKPLWEDQKTAPDVSSVLSKARTRLDTLKNERELEVKLTTAETAANNVAATDAKQLSSLRRNMEDLEMRSESMGGDFKSRLLAARTNLDRAFVVRLHDEAKAAKGPEALRNYATAEDETLKLFERALGRKNEEQVLFFKKHLEEIYAESDALVASTFPPEALEKLPAQDLLTDQAVKDTNLWHFDGLDGFRLDGSQLTAIGPKAGGTKAGIMDIPHAGGWRDFQLEMEFQFTGNIDMRFRLGRRVDFTAPGTTLSTVGNSASFKADQKYTGVATMLGSKLTVHIEGGDEPFDWSDDLKFNQQRKGAFAVVIEPGSEIKFSKLKLRLVR